MSSYNTFGTYLSLGLKVNYRYFIIMNHHAIVLLLEELVERHSFTRRIYIILILYGIIWSLYPTVFTCSKALIFKGSLKLRNLWRGLFWDNYLETLYSFDQFTAFPIPVVLDTSLWNWLGRPKWDTFGVLTLSLC